MLLFPSHKNITLTKAAYLPNIYYHENVQDTEVSCAILAPASQVFASAMLL